jgi:hypothetical protein
LSPSRQIQPRVLCGIVAILPCLFQEFSADDHFGRSHGFFPIQQRVLCGSVGILPRLSNFLQMTISADAMASFLFSSASSVEALALCPAFSYFLQMTILADAMAFFLFNSASSVEASAFCPAFSNFLSSLSFPIPIFCIDFPQLEAAAAA